MRSEGSYLYEEARMRTRTRRKRDIRAYSISVKRMTQSEIALNRALEPDTNHWRPTTRAECVDGPRPCPYAGCRHHLFLDVSPDTGAIKLNFPDLEVWEMGESCSLDVAEREGAPLEDVGAILNVTRERVRQLELEALAEYEAKGGVLREFTNPGHAGKRTGKELVPKPKRVPVCAAPPSDLKARLRQAIKARGITQNQAAREMQINLPTLSLWLNHAPRTVRHSDTAAAVKRWLEAQQ